MFKMRTNVSALVIARTGQTSNQLRSALKTIGFNRLTACSSHVAGLERIKTRNYQLVMFDAKPTDMPVMDFVRQALELDQHSILIAVSDQPRIDDVFGLLRSGARGFVVTPFTIEGMESVLMRADEGPPFSEAVLMAPDRNAALIGVVLNNLYRLSVLMRQAREFESARRELNHYKFAFGEAMELARLFCEGADESILLERIVEDCCTRANSASSRLGRMRQKLQKGREKEDEETVLEAEAAAK
jgi:hypothetical protein